MVDQHFGDSDVCVDYLMHFAKLATKQEDFICQIQDDVEEYRGQGTPKPIN